MWAKRFWLLAIVSAGIAFTVFVWGWTPGVAFNKSASIPWHTSVETARQQAASTGRPILIHFWSSTCQPCRFMDEQVFSDAEVAETLRRDFIPVRINVEQLPYTAKEFGVTALPTEVIVSPSGQILQRWVGAAERHRYLAQLVNFRRAWTADVSPAANLPASPPLASPTASPPFSTPDPRYDRAFSTGPIAPGAGPSAVASGPVLPTSPGTQAGTMGPLAGAAGYSTGSPMGGGISPSGLPVADPRPVGTYSAGSFLPTGALPPAWATQGSGYQMPMAASASAAPYASSPSPSSPTATVGGGMPASAGIPSGGSLSSAGSPALGASQAQLSASAAASPSAGSQPYNSVHNPGSLPPGCPPLGLEGFCPVQLVERELWVPGDPRWGLIHEGRTYLFSGPAERARFDAAPDRYAPVLSGCDVVLAAEQQWMVPGRIEHGAWYNGRIYLFSTEETLRRFDQNPPRYLAMLGSLGAGLNAAGAQPVNHSIAGAASTPGYSSGAPGNFSAGTPVANSAGWPSAVVPPAVGANAGVGFNPGPAWGNPGGNPPQSMGAVGPAFRW